MVTHMFPEEGTGGAQGTTSNPHHPHHPGGERPHAPIKPIFSHLGSHHVMGPSAIIHAIKSKGR
eukprot:4750635-Karenia_brevis.AAC.1